MVDCQKHEAERLAKSEPATATTAEEERWPPRISDKALKWNLDALKGILRGSDAAVVPLVVIEQELERARNFEAECSNLKEALEDARLTLLGLMNGRHASPLVRDACKAYFGRHPIQGSRALVGSNDGEQR